jgi:hypothetical protein
MDECDSQYFSLSYDSPQRAYLGLRYRTLSPGVCSPSYCNREHFALNFPSEHRLHLGYLQGFRNGLSIPL